jgi:opacity protein-like surface antigen
MTRSITLGLLLCSVSLAQAQSNQPWDGAYVGFNLGDETSAACNTWQAAGSTLNPASAASLSADSCAGGHVLGGLQVGEMFQFGRVIWGLGLDLDAASSPVNTQVVEFKGAAAPAGAYAFSGRTSPRGYAIAGPRLGYAGDVFQPYLRAGAILALGRANAKLSFTPAGATAADATFAGGKSFSTAGWVAGGGTEIGLNGAWSIGLEFLHANLGKGSDATAACAGAASACAAFDGLMFDDVHDRFSVNLYRIGITYWFGYWRF